MAFIVQHQLRGKSIDVRVPELFTVYVWGHAKTVEVITEFSYQNKQQFVVIFGEKKVIWTSSTLVGYFRTSIPLPEYESGLVASIHEDIF